MTFYVDFFTDLLSIYSANKYMGIIRLLNCTCTAKFQLRTFCSFWATARNGINSVIIDRHTEPLSSFYEPRTSTTW